MDEEKNIEKIIHLMRRDNSVDAPADAVKWAKNLFAARERKPSLVRRIAAVLQMDLAPGKAVMGERSGAPAEARQMLFGAGDKAIDLRVSGSKKLTITGQVLGDGFENATALLEGTAGRFESGSGGNSIFELKDVPKGTFTLIVRSGDEEIAVEGLEL